MLYTYTTYNSHSNGRNLRYLQQTKSRNDNKYLVAIVVLCSLLYYLLAKFVHFDVDINNAHIYKEITRLSHTPGLSHPVQISYIVSRVEAGLKNYIISTRTSYIMT